MRTLILMLTLALSLAPGWALAEAPKNVLPANAPKAWKEKCTACHARNGTGQTSMGQRMGAQDFTQGAWQKSRSDAQIRKVIAEGSPTNRAMRGYGKSLTPEELESLVTFIRSLDAAPKK